MSRLMRGRLGPLPVAPTFHSGKAIGPNLVVKFAPVTAHVVRLNITDGQGGPTINEFQLFAPRVAKTSK